MDITQDLKDSENLLRDFIGTRLSEKIEAEWLSEVGITEDRLERWKERKQVEEKRLTTGHLEERMIYYADFYDLHTILRKNWNNFSEVLGEWKSIDVFLTELGKLRDSDAHRRELLPHQKHLAIGISGEIRTRIMKWRSKMNTGEDCFPRIEFARDNLGNSYNSENPIPINLVSTGCTLRPDDTIDFSVTASDPGGSKLSPRGQSSTLDTIQIINCQESRTDPAENQQSQAQYLLSNVIDHTHTNSNVLLCNRLVSSSSSFF